MAGNTLSKPGTPIHFWFWQNKLCINLNWLRRIVPKNVSFNSCLSNLALKNNSAHLSLARKPVFKATLMNCYWTYYHLIEFTFAILFRVVAYLETWRRKVKFHTSCCLCFGPQSNPWERNVWLLGVAASPCSPASPLFPSICCLQVADGKFFTAFSFLFFLPAASGNYDVASGPGGRDEDSIGTKKQKKTPGAEPHVPHVHTSHRLPKNIDMCGFLRFISWVGTEGLTVANNSASSVLFFSKDFIKTCEIQGYNPGPHPLNKTAAL